MPDVLPPPLERTWLAPLDAVPGVRWSAAVRDAATGTRLAGHHPDEMLRTASVGKLFLLLEVARQFEAGELDPAEPLSWREEEHVADSGIWYLMHQRALPLVDLCVLVGAFSDNLATNVLLRRVGLDAVATVTRELGCSRSALLDRIRRQRTPQDPPTLSLGTAGELSTVLSRLHLGTAVSAAVSARVLGWLAAGADLSMVAAAFDLDPLAHGEPDRGLRLVNKTGTISTARADVGVVGGPGGELAYAVLAEWSDELDPRDEVLRAMRAVGGRLRRTVSGSDR